MEKFLLLIREDLIRREQMSPEEFYGGIKAMMQWTESLSQSGNYIQADALVNAGKYVSKDYIVSDGPFIEAKEAVSGFFLINAENAEQAASIAQTCPLIASGLVVIEVRPIMTIDNEQVNR